jgi:YVTN family beta-propeller protein
MTFLHAIIATALATCVALFGRMPLPASSGDVQFEPVRQLRKPVALALADDLSLLFVANQGSGTISTVDTRTLRVAAEARVGSRLSDLTITADRATLLATDEATGELIVFGRQGKILQPLHRLSIAGTPISIQVAPQGSPAFIASLWSRRLTIVDLSTREAQRPVPRIRKVLDLPFAPRRQLLVDDGRMLVIADAFGGRLAVVDTQTGALESVRSLPAHNIRGVALAASPDPRSPQLFLAHQMLNNLGTATRDDIHWGNLITNNLRLLPLTEVLAPHADLLHGSSLHYLGDVGRGAGDPAGVAVTSGGKVVVALAGMGQIAIGPELQGGWLRLEVGHRPTALAVTPDGRRAYVANTSSDSISIVDVSRGKMTSEVSLGPPPILTAAQRGERLFYDARLSHDGWFSCHSCHSDGHTTGLLNDNLSDGSYGTPKRILSLLGVGDTGPWAWNGSMPTLEKQIEQSIQSTMQGAKPSPDQVRDLAAFLKSLPPPPPAGAPETSASERGRLLFAKHACNKCHPPPSYTSEKSYDVGLPDEAGNRAFNPPSLRGVSQGGPYFHDGRATTLEDVLTRQRHQLQGDLRPDELRDLLSFLRTL